MKKRIEKAQKYLEWQKPNQAIAELHPLLKKEKTYSWIAYHMMGIALTQKGEYKKSITFLEKALDSGSKQAETPHMLSVNYYHLGQFEKAEQYAQQALALNENFLKAWLNLGSVYRAQAKLDEALECYQKANQIDPSNAGVAFRIGEIYRDQGDLKQAQKLFDITLKIDEDHKMALLEKAQIHKKNGEYDKAETSLRKAREKYGNLASIRVSEAELFKSRGDYDQAIALYQKLLDKDPGNGLIRVNYALSLQEVGQFKKSEENYRNAIKSMSDNFGAISNYLMGLHYNPENNQKYIFEEHVRLGKAFTPSDKNKRPVPFDKRKDKQLRIGFVSGGFRRHPVGWMIAGALEQLPKDSFEIYCYTTNNKFDFVTRRIHQNIDVWRSVVGYNITVIERIIREDELDILVDLSGHAADNCLEVMANEPAPIIVKWVGGLFNTTGIEAFDYLISDWQETPEGEEQYYTEKLVRMPDDYITYTPPAYASDVGTLPAKENGYITFGCFNNPTKINTTVLKKWAEIMRGVPQSRLYLKSKQYDTSSFREQILEVMQKEGIGRDRVSFEGHTAHDDHLEAYNKVDIALDPWPYSGGLTTCEALYMGVPVITLPGPTFAGRHSTTHLINAGLEQWVTDSWEEYTVKAVALANDQNQLEAWRNKLRDQLLNSSVCDGKRFGAHLSVAFREMWKQRVNGYENDVKEWQDHITIDSLPNEQIHELTDGPDRTPLITIKDNEKTEAGNATDEKNSGHNTTEESMIDSEELTQDVVQNGNGHSKENRAAEGHPQSSDEGDEHYFIETKDGVSICAPADLNVLTTYVLLEQEEWFEPELNFIRNYLKSGMQVVDVGAAYGAYALPMAKKVGSEGKIIAFEPSVRTRSYLERSKIENSIDQLEIIGRGLSDETGKAALDQAQTPELNTITAEGGGDEEVSLTTLNAWWEFAGRPELDLVKIDVNGMEPKVLRGSIEVLKQTSPVILISIGDEEDDLSVLQDTLNELDYRLFEYIPGPEVLAEHDSQAGVDAYMMNMIGIPKSRVQEFKENGWIFDEGTTYETPVRGTWKQLLHTLPWTSDFMDQWEENIASGQYTDYMEALDLICAAEQIETGSNRTANRSRKGAMMLDAAQKVIDLFNRGQADISVAMTFVRLMAQLGKRSQAIEMMKELMQIATSGKDITLALPFLPPLSEQDRLQVQSDLPKWVTVRIVEAWVMLKDHTTYLSGEQEQQMLKALEGNMEAMPVIERIAELQSINLHKNDSAKREEKHKSVFVHLCFNHIYAKSLSDLVEFVNLNSEGQKHWLYVEERQSIKGYKADIEENRHSFFFDFKKQLKNVIQNCKKEEVQAVFIHGLFFDWQKRLIKQIAFDKHIGWIIWGGDLYNPIKFERPLHDIAPYIDSLLTMAEGDIKIFEETYGQRDTYPFSYPYPGLYGQMPELKASEKSKTIIIGNSGDRTNEHIKILNRLSTKPDIHDYKLILPVSYNLFSDYRQELQKAITDLGLEDITELYEQFISPEEYVKLFQNAEIFLTAHNRQQSIGNILISLFVGNRTFLRKQITVNGHKKTNPSWEFLQTYGLKASPYEDLRDLDRLDRIEPFETSVVESHRSIIIEEFGLENRGKRLIDFCKQIEAKAMKV